MTLSRLLRRVVMFAGICQMISLTIAWSSHIPDTGPLGIWVVDNVAVPLFGVSWWFMVIAGVIQGLFTWETFKEFE